PRLLDVLLSLSGRLSHLPVDHGALLRIDVLESLLLLLLERVGALDQGMRLLGGADSLLLRLACGLGALPRPRQPRLHGVAPRHRVTDGVRGARRQAAVLMG